MKEMCGYQFWKIWEKVRMKTLAEEAAAYRNTPPYNFGLDQRFRAYVDNTPDLKAHRDFSEKHVYGFGERSFHWVWKLIADQMDPRGRFLEVGVYKGQIVSLMRQLLPNAFIVGVTPLSSTSGPNDEFPKFPETDYMQHIKDLHDHFGLDMTNAILEGHSQDAAVLQAARDLSPYDAVYIDGCHEYPCVIDDLVNYTPMVKPGGLFIVDDSSNFMQMWNGSFPGIIQVSQAVRDITEKDPELTHLLACMHLRVWRKAL